MKTAIITGNLLVSVASVAGASPEAKFTETARRIKEENDAQIDKAKEVYRKEFTAQLRSAGRIEVYIVDFDAIEREPNGGFEVFVSPPLKTKNPIRIAPYRAVTGILQTKVIDDKADRQSLLGALADRIGASNHSGGAFAHFPHHGIRIFAADNPSQVILESTFCWRCCNFGFVYPQGQTAWLSTSTELEKVFARLLPIPRKESDRYLAKYPDSSDENTVEKASAGQPATRPELKPEGSDKPQTESEGRFR